MIGVVPVQVPFEAVSVWPSLGVPEIVGSAVLTGGSRASADCGRLVALALPTGRWWP